MHLPPSSHFIYIPVIAMLGLALGFVLGARATRDAITQEQKKETERLARKAARDARHAQKDAASANEPAAKG
jgi:uncharacterized membrane protein